MKRVGLALAAVVLLAVGLVAGFLLRGCLPTDAALPTLNTSRSDSSASMKQADNTALLTTAVSVLDALKQDDWSAFSACIDPEQGVRFTPASTVSETDMVFTAKAFSDAAQDGTTYIWGVSSEDNTPIRLSVTDYIHTYVWDADYTAAGEIGIDTVLHSGNAEENVVSTDLYPESCRFLDFYIPSTDEQDQDWSSLKLVFVWSSSKERWYLTGVIHSGWTP